METIKHVFAYLDQLQSLFLQVKRLSSWTNFKPLQDREAIDAIVEKREGLIRQINEVVASLRPLREQLAGMNISDMVREIMLAKYQEVGGLQAQIQAADQRLMARIEKSLAALKAEMAMASQRGEAAAKYLRQSYSLAS